MEKNRKNKTREEREIENGKKVHKKREKGCRKERKNKRQQKSKKYWEIKF